MNIKKVESLVRELESTNPVERGSTSNKLKEIGSNIIFSSSDISNILKAIDKENDNLKVILDLIETLYFINTKEAIEGISSFFGKAARYLVDSDEGFTHNSYWKILGMNFQDTFNVNSPHAHRMWTLFILDDGRNLIRSDLSTFPAIRLALLHTLLNPDSSWNYKIRSFRILEKIDPSLLDLLTPELKEKYAFIMNASEEAVQRTRELVSSGVNASLKAVVKGSTNAFVSAVVAPLPLALGVTIKELFKDAVDINATATIDWSEFDTVRHLSDANHNPVNLISDSNLDTVKHLVRNAPQPGEASDLELLSFLKQLVYALT
jgi:hypothetical protein